MASIGNNWRITKVNRRLEFNDSLEMSADDIYMLVPYVVRRVDVWQRRRKSVSTASTDSSFKIAPVLCMLPTLRVFLDVAYHARWMDGWVLMNVPFIMGRQLAPPSQETKGMIHPLPLLSQYTPPLHFSITRQCGTYRQDPFGGRIDAFNQRFTRSSKTERKARSFFILELVFFTRSSGSKGTRSRYVYAFPLRF